MESRKARVEDDINRKVMNITSSAYSQGADLYITEYFVAFRATK